MATTANNGFTIPVSTDLVRNGATAIATLGTDIDTAVGKLPYTSFTPSITGTGSGWTLGTGSTATGRWCQIGKTVFVNGQITLGTSPSAGSNAFAVALPINANTNTTEWQALGGYYDNDLNDQYPCEIKISNTKAEFYVFKVVSSYVRGLAFDTTNKPVTPASGDVFSFSIMYQAA